jgi:hypothetical protein
MSIGSPQRLCYRRSRVPSRRVISARVSVASASSIARYSSPRHLFGVVSSDITSELKHLMVFPNARPPLTYVILPAEPRKPLRGGLRGAARRSRQQDKQMTLAGSRLLAVANGRGQSCELSAMVDVLHVAPRSTAAADLVGNDRVAARS